MENKREFLTQLFDVAISAARPEANLASHLPEAPNGRTIVFGAGKGAAQMALELERHYHGGSGGLSGLVVTRYGYGAPCEHVAVVEADHPVPDASGEQAAGRMMAMTQDLTKEDLVIALVCGGGSALLPAPPPGFSLEDEQGLNKVLLSSGLGITDMNVIRKHFSMIKGGRLAEMCHPARVLTLIVSDIPGDDPAQVASGPTVADHSNAERALEIIRLYNLPIDPRVVNYIASDASKCPKPGDAVFSDNQVSVIASAAQSLEAARSLAETMGLAAVILSDAIEGEAREIAKMHGAMAREIARNDRPFEKPVLLLSGGETTVTLRSVGKGGGKVSGKGGRNSEFLLSLAMEIDGLERVLALAADTDGIDGSEQNAGAFADGGSIKRMLAAGIDPRAALENNDAWTAFNAIGDLFEPGPTGTNVNDFRAILIL